MLTFLSFCLYEYFQNKVHVPPPLRAVNIVTGCVVVLLSTDGASVKSAAGQIIFIHILLFPHHAYGLSQGSATMGCMWPAPPIYAAHHMILELANVRRAKVFCY
jgi:hypothetical protein